MRSCSLLLMFAAAWLAGPSTAAELTVGVTASDQLPIARGDFKSGRYEGFARELLDDFAAKNGHKLSYRPLPILRLYDQFLFKRSLQLKFPDNPLWRTDLRQQLPVVYSQPLLRVTEGLAVLPNRLGRKREALRLIGAVRGYTPYPYLDAIAAGQLQLLEASSLEALVGLALNGRVDGIYVNATVLKHHLSERLQQPQALVLDSSLPQVTSAFMLSSISTPEIVTQLNAYLRNEGPTLERLRAKYRIAD